MRMFGPPFKHGRDDLSASSSRQTPDGRAASTAVLLRRVGDPKDPTAVAEGNRCQRTWTEPLLRKTAPFLVFAGLTTSGTEEHEHNSCFLQPHTGLFTSFFFLVT